VGTELRFGEGTAEWARGEIARARGNEVCFLLAVTAEGRLIEPRVVARGHSSAVLAVAHDFEPGNLLLHNHPSGDLTPSDADLAVAERLWAEGLGFAITDNEVGSLYVVVAPPPERRTRPLNGSEINADLSPGGFLSRAHPGYEDREGQRELARMVAELYSRPGIGLAEAGTGIGKSVAYLLPAIRWAVANKERTVVSTNTINLQEQLVRKDLPFLRRATGVPFEFALVKGRNNYVSIRRAKLASLNANSLFPDERAIELAAIMEWIERTGDGSLSDLSFRPSPEVWDEVASESDVCLRTKCPHFESCFYQRSRRDASAADILVVNHHLLFSDLAVRQAASNFSAAAVLPHYQRLILDEAHNVEDVATRHLGATLSRRGFYRVLRRLEHRGKGLLPTLEKALRSRPPDLLTRSCIELITERLRPELEGAWKRGAAVFRHLEAVVGPEGGGMLRLKDGFSNHPVWEAGLTEDLSATIAHLDTVVLGMRALRERVTVDEEAARALEEQLVELRGATHRIESAQVALAGALRPEGHVNELVRWVEVRGASRGQGEEREAHVVLAAAPLDLAGVLRESLWERVPTVVMTSATLATNDGFTFVRDRLGLADDLEVEEAVHPSPFDFSTQALLAIPTDLPVPGGDGDPRHAAATERVAMNMAEITDGGVFVLFTSYRALKLLASALRRVGADRHWPLFVHGEAPRPQLIERFIESGRGILLGTDSFWEGVDVPGHPLRGIVIPKLPFKVPTEPITSARAEAIEARGGNSFTSYMLPHAAIRLKQGFGRLIRSRSDRGAVVILDSRIVTRRYGRYLVDSLPPARVVTGRWEECHRALAEFYAE
jgi:ATP-dependent DNA helicase DinG